MDPFGLTATGLLVWGLCAHLVVDWLGQNDWMARNKAKRRQQRVWTPDSNQRVMVADWWWDRHPAAWVHAGLHGLALAPIFGWPAALIAVAHLLIDTRTPIVWWSRLIGQTQPRGDHYVSVDAVLPDRRPYAMNFDTVAFGVREAAPASETERVQRQLESLVTDMTVWTGPAYDIGTEVRFWTDQAAHVLCLMVAAVAVA